MQKWIGFFALLWLVGAILGSTYEEHTPAQWEARVSESKMEYLLNYKNTTYQQSSFGAITFPLPNSEYWSTALNVATFNFEFLQGEGYQFVRWFLQTIAIIGILAFVESAIQLLQGFIPFT